MKITALIALMVLFELYQTQNVSVMRPIYLLHRILNAKVIILLMYILRLSLLLLHL